MLLPITERRYSRLVRAIESSHAPGAGSEDLLTAELLPLEPSLGSPLERGRPRDRQLAEQLRNGTAVLALGESSTPQRVPVDLGQLIVAVSERTGLAEAEAADLVVCWANELRVVPALSSRETVPKGLEFLSYVEEGYRQERWSQLQALWLILATPFLDPQTGISAAVRPMRSAVDASHRETHLKSQWTRTECLLQTRRRLVAEYGLIAHLMARLESGERFFEGERRSLAQCLFTLAYSVQFTAKEAMTLLKLLRQITLSIGSGISGTGADAQITRGPLQGTSLNEAIDVLVLLSLSVRGVLDPTRYHPLENLHVLRGSDSLFSANKLLEDENFVAELERLLEDWNQHLVSAPKQEESVRQRILPAGQYTTETEDPHIVGGDPSALRHWHSANLTTLLRLVPLVAALFLMATPTTGTDPAMVDKYLQLAYESIKRGALSAILSCWVPWLEQQPGFAGDALSRPSVGAIAPLSTDLFADFVMDLGAAGVVSRLFEITARTIAETDTQTNALFPKQRSEIETGYQDEKTDEMTAYRNRQAHTTWCAQITRVLAAGARLAPESAYRFVLEPMGEFQVDLIRIVGDAYLDMVDLLYARVVDEDLLASSGGQRAPMALDERISSVSSPMLMAFLDLLRYTAVCAEPIWDYLENGGHPVANYAQLMRGLDTLTNRWQSSTETLSPPQIRHAEILAGLIRVLTALTSASLEIATLLRSEGELVEQCLKVVTSRAPGIVQHAAAEWLVQVSAKDPVAAAAQVRRALQRYGLFQAPFGILQEALWRARETSYYGFLTNLLLLATRCEPTDAQASARFAIEHILGAWDRYVYANMSEGWALAKALCDLILIALEQDDASTARSEQSIWSALRRPSEVSGAVSPALRALLLIPARACLLLRDEWWCPAAAQDAAIAAIQVLHLLMRDERPLSRAAGAPRRSAFAGAQVARLLAQCTDQMRALTGAVRPTLSGNTLSCAAASLLATLCTLAPATATTLADTSQLSHQCAQVLLTSTDHRLLQAVAELLCSGIYAGAQMPTWPRPPFRPFPPRVHPSGRLLVGIGATGLRVGTPIMALLQRLQQLTEWPLAALATPLFQLLLSLLQAPDVISLLAPLLLSRNERTERSLLTQWLRLLSSEAFVGLARLDRESQVPLLMGSVLECTALVVHCADAELTLGSFAGGGTSLGEITRGMARELLDRLVSPLLRRILVLDTSNVAAEATMTPLRAWHKLVAACFERLLSADSGGSLEWDADAATLIQRCLELAMEIAGSSESRSPATSSVGTLPVNVMDAGGADALFTIIHCCRILWRAPTWSKPDTSRANGEHSMAWWANPAEERDGDALRSAHEQALDRIANLCVTVAMAMQERSIAAETRLLLYAVHCALMDLLTPMSWPMGALDAPALMVEWNCQPEDRVRWTRVHVSKWVLGSVHAASKLEHLASSWLADATANGETALRAMVLATLTQALQLGASLAGVPLGAAAISAPETEATPKTRQIELFSPNKLAHVLMITNASAVARGGLDPRALEDHDAARDAREPAPAPIAIRQLYLYEQHLSFFNQIAATAWRQGSVLRMLPDLSEALHAWVAQGIESGLLLFPEVPLTARVSNREANRRRLALARRMAMLAAQLALLLPTDMPSLASSWRFLALCAIRLGSVWLATRSIATPETCLPALQLAKWYGRLLCSLPETVFVEHRELDTLRHSFVLQYLKLFPRRADSESDLDPANGAQTPLVVGTAPWDAAGPFATPLLVASMPRWYRAHDSPSIVTPREETTSMSAPMDPDHGNLLVSSYRLIRLELLRVILDLNMNCATPRATFPGLSEMIENANATPIGQAIFKCAGTEPPQRRMRAEHVSQGLLWLVSECVSSDRVMQMRGNAAKTAPPASVATPTTCPSWARERQYTYEAALYRELFERSLWFLLAVFEPSSSARAMVWPLSRTRTRPWVDWLYEELEKQRADSSWTLCRLLVRRIRQWIPASEPPMNVAGSEREQAMASS